MADKDITFFVFDQAPSMGSLLDISLEFATNLISTKIMRGKKQDKVWVVKMHDEETLNSMHFINPGDWDNCVVDGPDTFDWQKLIDLRQKVKINPKPVGEYEVDIPRSLAITLQHIAEQNQKQSQKERYTIFLLSDMKHSSSWDGLVELICEASRRYNVLLSIVYFPLDSDKCTEEQSTAFNDNLQNLNLLLEELKKLPGRPSESSVCLYDEAARYLGNWQNDPIRLYKPTRVFLGEIRMGADLDSNDLNNSVAMLRFNRQDYDKAIPKYDVAQDPKVLRIKVDGYPFIKEDQPVLTQEIGVRVNETTGEKTALNIKHTREHYIKLGESNESGPDDEESPENPGSEENYNEVKTVDQSEIQEAYKYGSSTIPISNSIREQLVVATFCGIDILHFTPKKSLPPWYFRGESEIILNHQNGAAHDQLAFDMLAQSLLHKDMIAIVRYVKKDSTPVKLAALIPGSLLTDWTKQKTENRNPQGAKRDHDEAVGDERIPNLPLLSGIYGINKGIESDDRKNQKDEENFPTTEILGQMDQLVRKMDLDALNGIDDIAINEDIFVELNDAESLAVMNDKGIEKQTRFKSFNDLTRHIMSQNSPRLHLIQMLIKQICEQYLKKAKPGDNLYNLIQREYLADPKSFKNPLDKALDEFYERNKDISFVPSFSAKNLEEDESFIKLRDNLKQLLDIQEVAEQKLKEEPKGSKTALADAADRPDIDEVLDSVLR